MYFVHARQFTVVCNMTDKSSITGKHPSASTSSAMVHLQAFTVGYNYKSRSLRIRPLISASLAVVECFA